MSVYIADMQFGCVCACVCVRVRVLCCLSIDSWDSYYASIFSYLYYADHI